MTDIQIPEHRSEAALHSHCCWELHAVLMGPVRCSCGGKTAVLGGGDVLFVPAGIDHALPDTGQLVTIQLEPGPLLAATPYAKAADHPEAFRCFLKRDTALHALVLALEECCRLQPFCWELTARGLALQAAGALLQRHCDRAKLLPPIPADRAQRYARWVESYIRSHYSSPISLDQLAEELGLTKSYLCRVFREYTGTTIINYVNRIRCEKAITLVASGHSVTQAALQVGFNDYNYFSRVFKKTIGKRPSDFIGKDRA